MPRPHLGPALLAVALAGCGGDGDELPAATRATDLCVGNDHSCALLDDGTVRCWGSAGPIGVGVEESVGDDEAPSAFPALRFPDEVVQIACGASNTCALTDAGSLYCWGGNVSGVLGPDAERIGDDERADSVGPMALPGPVAHIGASERQVCATLEDERSFCWGKNGGGSLGLGVPAVDTDAVGDDEAITAYGPVALSTPVLRWADGSGGRGFRQCALLEGGALQCWGAHGGDGPLGQGYVPPGCEGGACSVTECCIGDEEPPDSIPPVELGGAVTDFALNPFGAVALLSDGSVRAWSLSVVGVPGAQLPIGDDELVTSLPPIQLGEPAIRVASSTATACAILESGTVRCWGSTSNLIFESTDPYVGDDEHPSDIEPIPLSGSAIEVGLGTTHACALLENGQVQCWGRGDFGQLGYPGVTEVGGALSIDDAGYVPLF